MKDNWEEDLANQIAAEKEKLGLVKKEEEKIEAPKDEKKEIVEEVIAEIKEEKEVDPYLEEALKMGYDPNYSGPDKKSPKRFVEDGSYFKKISELKREIQETREFSKKAMEHAAKVEKAANEKLMADLQKAKMEAFRNGDETSFKAAEEQQKVVQEQMQEVKPVIQQTPQPQPVTPELQDFANRNKSWFNLSSEQNRDLVEEADVIDRLLTERFKRKGIMISQKEHLQMVEDTMRKQHPELFENVNQNKAPKTLVSTVSSDEKANTKLADKLTTQQREFVRKARQYGSKLTDEEYARQLKLAGDLRE